MHNLTIETLLSEMPRFHAMFAQDRTAIPNAVSHGIQAAILHWIGQNVRPGFHSLETGCGYSSIAFISAGARHTVVSPTQSEHESIQKWCVDHEVSLENARFLAGRSQAILPTLETESLDVVLIDGDHAFPGPYLEWAFTADRLKKDGVLIVDDTDLVTGTILESFLLMERHNWILEDTKGKTSFFRKLVDGTVTQPEWHGLQPFAAKRDRSVLRRIRRKLAQILAHSDDALFWR
jgi:hypothetical protein